MLKRFTRMMLRGLLSRRERIDHFQVLLMQAIAKTERLEARVPVFLKRIIQRAADLQGCSITDFVISTLDKSARETVREHELMKLNAEDSRIFAQALIDPPKPNAALRRAFAAHSKMVSMK